jgi:hypothetical protein
MDTQIKKLTRTIGCFQGAIGLKTFAKNLPEIQKTQITGKLATEALGKIGINPQNILQQDVKIYSTSWEEFQPIITGITDFLKWFNWTAETGDCDNRAAIVTALCGVLAGINSCAYVHCDRENIDDAGYKGGHLTNVFIDKDGNTYLFDVDNNFLTQKISNNDCIMGREKYHFDSARIF